MEKNVIFKLRDLFRVNSSLYLIPGTTDFPATGDSPPVPLKGWLFGQSRPHREVHADGQIQYGRALELAGLISSVSICSSDLFQRASACGNCNPSIKSVPIGCVTHSDSQHQWSLYPSEGQYLLADSPYLWGLYRSEGQHLQDLYPVMVCAEGMHYPCSMQPV